MPIKSSVVDDFADECDLYILLYSPTVFQKSQQLCPIPLPSPLLAPSPGNQTLLATPLSTPAPLHIVPTEDENDILVLPFSQFEESRNKELCRPALVI